MTFGNGKASVAISGIANTISDGNCTVTRVFADARILKLKIVVTNSISDATYSDGSFAVAKCKLFIKKIMACILHAKFFIYLFFACQRSYKTVGVAFSL